MLSNKDFNFQIRDLSRRHTKMFRGINPFPFAIQKRMSSKSLDLIKRARKIEMIDERKQCHSNDFYEFLPIF
jgi:hypothetical protein